MEDRIKIISEVLKTTDLASVEDNKDYKWLATQIAKELSFYNISK